MAMTLSEELRWRGFIQQSTLNDLSELDKKQWTFYHGFDASTDSQTIGNLAAMMLDKVFMRHGHKAILLAGGATSLIGDPGGKDKERQLQDEKTIARNVEQASKQLKRVFDGQEYKLVNNLDWMKEINALDYLRDVGKYFSMTPLVQRDYIAKRIGEGGSGISYTEFSYTILQGLDYLYLYDKFGCELQLGGSDQWGNCLSGVELIRRARGAEVHAMTLPLIVDKTTGKKFGKSEKGAIWLDEAKTSLYKFYQFWLNIDDGAVESALRIFTELSKDQIDQVMAEFKTDKGDRLAQKTLAYQTTRIVHGQKRADEIKTATDALFGKGEYLKLSKEEKKILHNELPVTPATEDLPEVIANAGLASSKSEARKFLEAGAIYVNGQKAGPKNLHLFVKGDNLLRRGKNSFAIVEK
jgi:tyrosyl-tRNA synthetase